MVLLTFLSLTFVLTCEPCFGLQFQCCGLLSARPDVSCALWLGLLFAFSLFRILLSFSFDLTGLQEIFQLPKENNFLNHCYHGVACIIISALNFILCTTMALSHDIKDPLLLSSGQPSTVVESCDLLQCVGIVKKFYLCIIFLSIIHQV